MHRRPAVRSGRARALLLLLALPALAQCGIGAAASRRAAAPVPPPATGDAAVVRLAADPSLQQLLDPYPSTSGPSWLGADVASSIRLADDRWVWIFGDTLLGTVSDRCPPPLSYCARVVAAEPGARMIANSAGTMVRSADGVLSPVVKYWRADETGAPAAIFVAPGDGFLWPLAGVRVGTVLLVAANRHTLASGLLPVDNLFLRVLNPDAPPDAWLYDSQPIPGFRPPGDGQPILSWTSALVAVGDFVYVFGSLDVGVDARTVLARLDARAVTDGDWQPVLQYLQRGAAGAPPEWSDVLDPARLEQIEGLPGTSEGTIDFAAGIGWYTFQIPPLHYEIRLYTASDLLGAWRDRGAVYEIPAAWRATSGDCPDPDEARSKAGWGETDPACAPRYAAYAPKAHPELGAPGGYVVTYNVNTWGGGLDAAVQALQTQHGFYVPQVLSGAP